MRLLAERSGARGRFGRALMLNNLGSRYFQAEEHDKARQLFEAALAQTELGQRPLPAEASAEDIELLAIPQNLALIEPDDRKRQAMHEHTMRSLELTLGPGHPRTESAREQQGMTTLHPARARALVEAACAGHQRWALTRSVTICAYEAAWLADELGDQVAAVRWMRVASGYKSTSNAPREKGNLAAAYVSVHAPAPGAPPVLPADILRIAEVALARPGLADRIDAADAYALAARVETARGDLHAARASRAAAVRALENIALPTYERRVARARAELALVSPDRAEAVGLAELALRWYRAAGGYDNDIARLAPLVAERAPLRTTPAATAAPATR